MKIEINQDERIELTEVFNSISLKTRDNETIVICMRDSGFEFDYEGEMYHAKEGRLIHIEKAPMKPNSELTGESCKPESDER